MNKARKNIASRAARADRVALAMTEKKCENGKKPVQYADTWLCENSGGGLNGGRRRSKKHSQRKKSNASKSRRRR